MEQLLSMQRECPYGQEDEIEGGHRAALPRKDRPHWIQVVAPTSHSAQ